MSAQVLRHTDWSGWCEECALAAPPVAPMPEAFETRAEANRWAREHNAKHHPAPSPGPLNKEERDA